MNNSEVKKNVIVIQTSIANTASMITALKRVGANPQLTSQAKDLESADFVVLPGVGAFHAGMNQLEQLKITDILRRRIEENKPTLAVCLGLQLLCQSSEESPGIKGLSVIPSSISKFDDSVRVPQLGWNLVRADSRSKFIEQGFAYFANSYRMQTCPEGWIPGITSYGKEFVSVLERGNILACQFHPELSGPWGLNIIKRWLGQN